MRNLGVGVAGVAIACGISYAGFAVGNALLEARASQRVVTVKGLSEREVAADLALWPIVFQARGDELSVVHAKLEGDAKRVRAFLEELAIEDEAITTSEPLVTDHGPGFGDNRIQERFSVQSTIAIRTSDVARISEARARIGQLVGEGIELVNRYDARTEYLFTRLDELKPEMIAEATRDARRAAQQFAADSQSQVGSIRNAQQGYFSISDRDAFSPQVKKVRVVTTVQYFLTDASDG